MQPTSGWAIALVQVFAWLDVKDKMSWTNAFLSFSYFGDDATSRFKLL